MWKNYFFTAIRSYRKQKGLTFLNLSGLTIGIATSLLIILWVVDELSFDTFHEHSDQLYKVMENQHYSGDIYTFSATPGPFAQAFKEKIPEVIASSSHDWQAQVQFTVGEKILKESGLHVAPDFLTMFTFPLIAGDRQHALDDRYSIIISEPLAEKYFGSTQQAMGKAIQIDNGKSYTVTGVSAPVPANSSIDFDFLLPYEDYYMQYDWLHVWSNNSVGTYVMLDKHADVQAVNAKIQHFLDDYVEDSSTDIFLFPVKDSYLYGNFKDGQQSGGRILYVRLFVVVAAFIILIACINFMNLVTARSPQRAREIGVRKVIGAEKKALIWQFLSESTLMVLAASLTATLLVELILPWFNQLTGKQIDIPLMSPFFLLGLATLVLVTGALAGLYPALVLSSFNSIKILKGTFKLGTQGATFRQGLVVFQFVLSMILITATVVVYQQIQFIKNKELGVDKEKLLYIPLSENLGGEKFAPYKRALLRQPGIESVALSSQSPLSVSSSTSSLSWDGEGADQEILFQQIQVGYDFLKTTGIQLAEGRDFSEAYSTDTAAILLNEEAVRRMGLESPVGQEIRLWDEYQMQIIGVVKDFHSHNLHAAIEPLFIMLAPESTWMALVRTKAGETPAALAGLEAVHSQFNAENVFEYHFLDQEYDQVYHTDTLIGKMAGYFASIAIFISCLGLFGLAAYTAERRVKEIGVRKVLGASTSRLVSLLSASFAWMVLIAFVIAAPVSWWLMSFFLDDYAYHITLSPIVFLLTGLSTLLISWLTVGYQSIKAALANPVDALRSE